MAGVRQIVHKNIKIIVVDLANCEIKDIPGILTEAKTLILSFPLQSVIVVTDVTGTKYNRESISFMREYAAVTSPFLKAGAVVGVTDLKKIIYNTIMTIIRKNYPCFDTMEKALDWLAEQE